MRKASQLLGMVMVLQGVGGAVDQLGVRLWGGLFLAKHLEFLAGYEIFANVVLAVVGVVVVVAADRVTAPRPTT